jgi:hypothetical protein
MEPTPMPNATEAQFDRRPAVLTEGAEDHNEGLMHGANELRERAGKVASDLAGTVKKNPYATLAVAAGLAFAIGALWKIRATRQQSQLKTLIARLPELPSAERLRSYWR